jgi:hypothetical protein
MSSFHVDARVSIKLEYELAMRLGEFILSAGTEDKQFLALGHKLVSIDEEEVSKPPKRNWEGYYRDDESPKENPINESYWEKSYEKINAPIKITRKYSNIK